MFVLTASGFAQENFGIKDKVENYLKVNTERIVGDEILSRINKYKKLESDPKKYYESLGLTDSELKGFYKLFPGILKENLPKITLNKAGLLKLTYKDQSAHFTFSDLGKGHVYINNVLVKLPSDDVKSFPEYFNSFNKNLREATSKKTTFLNIIRSFSLISSANAQTIIYYDEYVDESDLPKKNYLDYKDGDDIPHYHKDGYDPKDKVDKNLYDDTDFAHNVNQTKQILLAAIMAISNDIKLYSEANWANKKKNLPSNLKILYGKIDRMAKSCDKERLETNGKFREGSDTVKMLTALDLVNEKINRLDTMGKDWQSEVDELVWRRTSFHVDFNGKSFNICKSKKMKSIYFDPNLCSNLNKITQCLIDFRTSGKVSDKRLSDKEMDLLLENPTGRDYGQEDILKWIQEK